MTMDLRGYGYSAKPTDPSSYADLNQQADDVEAVIQQLGLHKPVLAGWSLGGIIVKGYLAKYGDQELSGVDLIDFVICPDTNCQTTILNNLGSAASLPNSISTDANTALEGETEFINLETGASEAFTNGVSATDRLVLQEIIHNAPQYARAATLAGATPDLAPSPQLLENLHVPLLVQNGQNDPLYPVSLIPGEVNLVKNATVKTYPTVAHMPFFLAPDAFNRDLATWALTKTVVRHP